MKVWLVYLLNNICMSYKSEKLIYLTSLTGCCTDGMMVIRL